MRGLLVLSLMLAGCAGASPEDPPTVRYGEETCAQCHMLISDPRFAAALAVEGEARVFDDIGCLLRYLQEHPETRAGRLWVHDAGSEDWLAAATARFVYDPELATPMGSGLAAYATSEGAMADADRQTMTWDQVLSNQEAVHAK